jgi:uncharacterized protein YceK
MKNLLCLAGIGLLLLPTGCGSLGSRWRGGSGAYQGVRFDYGQIVHHSTESELIAVADIPLSAIVDTLFLPYDLSVEEREKSDVTNASSASSASTARIGHK